jgi:hypothetical protein
MTEPTRIAIRARHLLHLDETIHSNWPHGLHIKILNMQAKPGAGRMRRRSSTSACPSWPCPTSMP